MNRNVQLVFLGTGEPRYHRFLGDLASAAFAGGFRPALGARMCEQLRLSARLPHKTMWVEYDLHKAQNRTRELMGHPPINPREVPQREGWLLQQHPTLETAIMMHLFTSDPNADDKGFNTWGFPVTYCWTVDDLQPPWPSTFALGGTSDAALATGILSYNSPGVTIARSPLLTYVSNEVTKELVREWVGVLRRCWALLATLNDIPMTIGEVRQTKGFLGRGQIRKFLSHKTLTLSIPGKQDTRVLARKLVALARRRAHEVRGHWRADWRFPGAAGCEHEWNVEHHCVRCGARRMWIHEHQRGDAALGFVNHDYVVSHPEDQHEVGGRN